MTLTHNKREQGSDFLLPFVNDCLFCQDCIGGNIQHGLIYGGINYIHRVEQLTQGFDCVVAEINETA